MSVVTIITIQCFSSSGILVFRSRVVIHFIHLFHVVLWSRSNPFSFTLVHSFDLSDITHSVPVTKLSHAGSSVPHHLCAFSFPKVPVLQQMHPSNTSFSTAVICDLCSLCLVHFFHFHSTLPLIAVVTSNRVQSFHHTHI